MVNREGGRGPRLAFVDQLQAAPAQGAVAETETIEQARVEVGRGGLRGDGAVLAPSTTVSTG